MDNPYKAPLHRPLGHDPVVNAVILTLRFYIDFALNEVIEPSPYKSGLGSFFSTQDDPPLARAAFQHIGTAALVAKWERRAEIILIREIPAFRDERGRLMNQLRDLCERMKAQVTPSEKTEKAPEKLEQDSASEFCALALNGIIRIAGACKKRDRTQHSWEERFRPEIERDEAKLEALADQKAQLIEPESEISAVTKRLKLWKKRSLDPLPDDADMMPKIELRTAMQILERAQRMSLGIKNKGTFQAYLSDPQATILMTLLEGGAEAVRTLPTKTLDDATQSHALTEARDRIRERQQPITAKLYPLVDRNQLMHAQIRELTRAAEELDSLPPSSIFDLRSLRLQQGKLKNIQATVDQAESMLPPQAPSEDGVEPLRNSSCLLAPVFATATS